MPKVRKSRKPPSRKRYEDEHPTRSCRLDKEDDELLREHLEHTGRSFADFVKDHLRKEEAMVKEKAEILASRKVDASVEDRVRCLENLVHEIFSLTVNTRKYPPYCPRCEAQELFECEGRETESTARNPWLPTWKCPKCGYFINTYNRIDPKSIKWVDNNSGGYTNKPKPSTRH